MTSIAELHQEANKLRQEKKYADACTRYEELWPETGDQYDGAGLLNCLRKLKQYDKAIPLAKELIEKFPDFQWGKNEAIWTLIEGKLYKLGENDPLDGIITVANEIMELGPEGLALKMVIFKVLKCAKEAGQWDVVYDWVDKISPEDLSIEPMTDAKGREGWCDQTLWYNYKAKSLIKKDKSEEVLEFIDDVIEKFPRQKKFFVRLKALAQYKLGKLDKAEECYKELCFDKRADWWLLHEYAKVLRDKGFKEKALKIMYQAAISHKKLDSMVTLFKEIGLLCKEIGKNEEARAHLTLSSLVRSEQGWSISEEISTAILELNRMIGNDIEPASIKEALSICRREWKKLLGDTYLTQSKRKPKGGLTGTISLGRGDRPFCFINGDDNESYFCFKSALPDEIKDGDKVSFDVVPSYDKKKNKESWKAVNINKL